MSNDRSVIVRRLDDGRWWVRLPDGVTLVGADERDGVTLLVGEGTTVEIIERGGSNET